MIWDRFVEFEYSRGDLNSISKVEQRRANLYPELRQHNSLAQLACRSAPLSLLPPAFSRFFVRLNVMFVWWTWHRVLSVCVFLARTDDLLLKRKSAAHKIPCRNRFMDLWPCTTLEIDMLELSKDAEGQIRPLDDTRKCNFEDGKLTATAKMHWMF